MKTYKIIYDISHHHLTIEAHHVILGEDGVIFMSEGDDMRQPIAFFPYGELIGFYEYKSLVTSQPEK